MKKLEYNYSPELDILSADDTEREYEKSVQRGDFILDIDTEGEIRGIEIQNVSQLLGIDREQLNNIEKVSLIQTPKNTVAIKIETGEQVNTLSTQINHQTPA